MLFLFIIFSCWACEKKDTAPEGVLPKARMVSFLIDMHIAEARINDLSLRRDSSERFFKVVEDSLFKKHGIPNDTVYLKSYEYYLKDVQGLDDIYSAVVDSLSLRERLSKEEVDKKTEADESAKSDTTKQAD